ncbi:MAG: hypothetical protein HYS53_03570 [Candidatus Aenigmarchaeota archaeon]|nr:hypothetical protein [Candidatus Aenigmarchaeota archaeon]
MVNLDDTISLVVFVVFFALAITYFSTLNRPDRIELESLAGNIADKILTPGYLTWNVTKTYVIVNASSAQNLYPVDIYIAFPDQVKSNSVRARYHDTGKEVGFVYANVSTGEFVMLANLSAGKNIFGVFYSDTDATGIEPNSDLGANGLLFSNDDLAGEFSPDGDIVSVSYRNGDNPWLRDRLFLGASRYQASSYTVTRVPVRIQYDFTNGSATKTFKIYAFNSIIRLNISAASYTWNMRFATAINRTFANSDISMNGTNTLVFSNTADFVDVYTSPGSTTTGIAFSDKNINATVYDAAGYREFNISNTTASSYEMYYHHGSYANGKPYNDLRVSPGATQLATDLIEGVKASKITDFNATGYAAIKQRVGSSKDFHIEIENSSDGTLLLDYGKQPSNFTEVVVHRKALNLLTTDYDFQKVVLRVKTWN